MMRLHKFGLCTILLLVICATPAETQKIATDGAQQPVPTKGSRGGGDVKKDRFAPTPAPAPSWAPPDVDAAVPPVDSNAQCSLPTVLQGAADRVQDLVASLPKFAATERMQHYEADPSGKWRNPQTVVFEYLVEMKQPRTGMLVMDETRDGGLSLNKFPAHLATLGLPVTAMVFHPIFVGEYNMKCEGLGQWDGHRAWQIYFQQRPDKYPRLRGYRIKNQSFAIRLKGRAWVDAETFQPLHIETDLMEPVPQILLFREHLAVDYRPVHFRKENEDLWLQQSAEVFMDYKGHHYRRVHKFTDFLMFSVETNEQVKAPKEQ
ncbi:MAG TPA: hypothetical protein VF311_12670 [Terriglobales bacterium]